MAPLYSGSADEWSYLSNDTIDTAMTMDFIIDRFENQMKKTKTLKSHQFTVRGTLWHIEVLTVGSYDDIEKSVGIKICNDSKKDLTVDCKIEIGDEVRKLHDIIDAENSFGFVNFLTHQECREVLNDGKLIVKVEIKVLEEESTLIHGKGKQPIQIPDPSSVYLKMFEEKAFTDFIVVCEEESIPCHKVFLVGRSSVFKTMMESNMKEAKEATVELKNCTSTVAKSFVEFFYTGHVDDDILRDNAVSFLDLGEKYDLSGLKAIAEQVMTVNLDKENMISYFLAGDLYNGKNIRAAAKTFLRQNKRHLVEQDGWEEALKGRGLVFELMKYFSQE